MVTSSEPTGTSVPSTAAIRAASRWASGDPAGRDAEQDQVVGALGAFEDLVGDPGEGPADVGGLEHPAYDTGAQVSAGRVS